MSIALLFHNLLIDRFPKVAVILTCYIISEDFLKMYFVLNSHYLCQDYSYHLRKSSQFRLPLATFWVG